MRRMPMRVTTTNIFLITFILSSATFVLGADEAYDYRLLSTNRTSTMQKELNEAADAGYRIERVMGGETGFGGSEVVVVMSKSKTSTGKGRYAYKLLATNRTSTMQKELNEAGNEGFLYKDQTGLPADDTAYLSWTTNTIEAISKKFRVNGQVGGSFDFRIRGTERAYNYKLRATWFTPEMIQASVRYWQLRERLSEEQTQALVAEAEAVGDTVVMVELDPREGSGVIPSSWLAIFRAKGSSVEAKGMAVPAFRSVKALAGTVQRDYAYDVFWVVFPLVDEKGQAILPD